MTPPAISFRAVEAADSDRLLAWRNAPEVAAYMYSDHVISAEEHARWFAGLKDDATRAYWIILMEGAPVGLVNLAEIGPKGCVWAYYLADPSVRGKGAGAYVELRMLDHVFDERGLDVLGCEVLVANKSVWRLHQSFGFEITETLPGRAVKGGEAVDAYRMALTAAGWKIARQHVVERLAARGFDTARQPLLES